MPACAVETAFDYVFWRVTDKDPRPNGHHLQGGVGLAELEDAMVRKGYVRLLSPPPSLAEGDVLIAAAHAGIVEKSGRIAHWLPVETMETHRWPHWGLPKHEDLELKRPPLKGGLFPNDTLRQFLGRPNQKTFRLVYWRKMPELNLAGKWSAEVTTTGATLFQDWDVRPLDQNTWSVRSTLVGSDHAFYKARLGEVEESARLRLEADGRLYYEDRELKLELTRDPNTLRGASKLGRLEARRSR